MQILRRTRYGFCYRGPSNVSTLEPRHAALCIYKLHSVAGILKLRKWELDNGRRGWRRFPVFYLIEFLNNFRIKYQKERERERKRRELINYQDYREKEESPRFSKTIPSSLGGNVKTAAGFKDDDSPASLRLGDLGLPWQNFFSFGSR